MSLHHRENWKDHYDKGMDRRSLWQKFVDWLRFGSEW